MDRDCELIRFQVCQPEYFPVTFMLLGNMSNTLTSENNQRVSEHQPFNHRKQSRKLEMTNDLDLQH